MDPVEVREERVTTGPPVATTTAPHSTTAPAAPVATRTEMSRSRTAVNPVGDRLTQLVWLIVGVVDIILALDFVFRAAGANHGSGFVHYIYRLGGWLSAPFDGIFNTTTAANGVSVMRWADVIAIAIYAIAAWIVVKLVKITATQR